MSLVEVVGNYVGAAQGFTCVSVFGSNSYRPFARGHIHHAVSAIVARLFERHAWVSEVLDDCERTHIDDRQDAIVAGGEMHLVVHRIVVQLIRASLASGVTVPTAWPVVGSMLTAVLAHNPATIWLRATKTPFG
jgi:hypothetical protein